MPRPGKEPLTNDKRDIAKRADGGRMDVEAPGRRPFQVVYLNIDHESLKLKNEYTPPQPASTSYPVLPGREELQGPNPSYPKKKRFLEVGLIIGKEPRRHMVEPGSQVLYYGKKRSTESLRRDRFARRVFIPVTDAEKKRIRLFVGCDLKRDNSLWPQSIQSDCVFFYPEYWRVTEVQGSDKRTMLPDLIRACRRRAVSGGNLNAEAGAATPASPGGAVDAEMRDIKAEDTDELEDELEDEFEDEIDNEMSDDFFEMRDDFFDQEFDDSWFYSTGRTGVIKPPATAAAAARGAVMEPPAPAAGPSADAAIAESSAPAFITSTVPEARSPPPSMTDKEEPIDLQKGVQKQPHKQILQVILNIKDALESLEKSCSWAGNPASDSSGENICTKFLNLDEALADEVAVQFSQYLATRYSALNPDDALIKNIHKTLCDLHPITTVHQRLQGGTLVMFMDFCHTELRARHGNNYSQAAMHWVVEEALRATEYYHRYLSTDTTQQVRKDNLQKLVELLRDLVSRITEMTKMSGEAIAGEGELLRGSEVSEVKEKIGGVIDTLFEKFAGSRASSVAPMKEELAGFLGELDGHLAGLLQ